MKKVMIIGANWEQEPLLQKAKEMGLYVIATNPYSEAEGFKYSDESYIVEPRDLQKLDEIFQKTQPNAVISDECDYSMFAVAYLTDKYNLPGPKIDSLIITNNKYLQRLAAKKIGIFQPNFILCMTFTEVINAVDKIGLPVMLKPIDNRGSIGINKVEHKDDLKRAFFDAIANSHSRQIIVEKFVLGNIITVEGIYTDTFYNLSFSTKKMHPEFPSNAMHLQYPGNLSDNVIEKIYAINTNLIQQIGIDFGFTHSEFIVNGDEINFLEIANRGGGVHISNKILPSITGLDLTRINLNCAFGNNAPLNNLNQYTPEFFSLLHFFDFGSGKVKSIKNLDNAKQIKGVLAIRLNFTIEDVLGDIETALNRPGFVIVVSESLNECESIISQVENEMTIEFEHNGGL